MNYQRGDKGAVIRCAQYALHLMRVYRMDIDDSFGPGMEQAILGYQADRELEETGSWRRPEPRMTRPGSA